MSPSPRIDVPSTRDDELPLRSLVATSLACLALGLTVAYGITKEDAPSASATAPSDLAASASLEPEQAAPPAPEPPAAAPPAPPAPAPAPPEPTAIAALAAPAPAPAPPEPTAIAALAAPAPATPDAATPPDRAAAPVPVPVPVSSPAPAPAPSDDAPPSAPTDPRHLRIETGVFAYLRCEGVPKRRGKYPCPRDRELEARMRTIVEQLPGCREAHAIPRGRSFDVRIELGAGGKVDDLLVKAPNDAAERAVRACAGPALRRERTALKTTRMIVSMRFKVR